MAMRCRLVVLISGSGSNLQAIIDAVDDRRIPGEIIAVISNRPGVKGLERAKKAGIPAITLDHTGYADRAAFDRALQQQLETLDPDLVILAGFMRILPESLVNRFHGKMLNIHPSLLPKYRGLHTHRRALENGDAQHGVSVHFVTPELDGGPVIIQAHVDVAPDHTEETLAADVLKREHRIYPLVVQWYCQGRLRLEGDTPLLDDQLLESPLRYSEELERRVG